MLAVATALGSGRLDAQIQLGLRLDPLSSMQWSGSRIFLEGERRSVLATSADQILDVWPGPVAGAFGVSTSKGVGVLLGRDVVVGGQVLDRAAVVRSSRYDALWALRRSADRGGEIVELRSGGLGRTVVREARSIRDFDVDVRGRIVYLTNNDTLTFAVDDQQHVDFPLPPELRGATRVFVDAESSEIAVYTKGWLGRHVVGQGDWTFEPVSEATQALVRHAWSRRMSVEPRFR